MPTAYQIKKLILESLRQDVSRKALAFLSKTKRPLDKKYDLIALRNMSYMFTPREYERLAGDWKFATGNEIPVTLQEALDYMEEEIST
tara:strand:+ start:59 stop:322 length:264 start_codon:yes stop_codon:yes gene_type:complete